jgi:NodT family efflux transporter outer membrane factor (OMF) lipoprotein
MIMHMKNIFKPGVALLFTIILIPALSSCKVLEKYKKPEPVSEQTLFRDMSTGDTLNLADIPWRDLFTDKYLVSLIEEALNNNPDLQIAVARMKKAEAAFKQSRAAFFPSFSMDANAYLNGTGESTTLHEYQLTGSSSWEADIWGRLRNTNRAALDLLLKSEAYKRTVQTQLIADVANSYYMLLALDTRLMVTEKSIELRNSDVETMKIMKESDMVTGADLVQGQASLYSAKVSVPDIKQTIYETENMLSLLLGRNPGPVPRGTLYEQMISADLKTGMPARLIVNRPDVQEAEYQLRYGVEMTNAARKRFYPSLTITATGGYSVTDLAQMFEPESLFWNLIGGLTQPIFNQGLNRQRLKSALADQDEYLAVYKQVLLRSGQEVANAMYGYQTATEKITLRASQIEYLEKSVDFTMELLKYTSTTNYTDVLMAEMNLLNAQLGSIDDKLQQLQSVVMLYKSLGGGWKK